MRPTPPLQASIDSLGRSLAEALGNAVVSIAVYGSAASDDFSPGHSDVNLLVVLREVSFADLRLIGDLLRRAARADLRIATPLVVTPSFLRDARDSYPIELADLRDRHRVLAGEDVVAGIAVAPERLREQAEREVRGKLLKLRGLAVHRPSDAEVEHALASAVATFEVIERALLRAGGAAPTARGVALFEEVERRQRIPMRALARLARLRAEGGAWPSGPELDELLAAVLREVEALVAFVDGTAA
jgi:predicted nucleotidyltransferase